MFKVERLRWNCTQYVVWRGCYPKPQIINQNFQVTFLFSALTMGQQQAHKLPTVALTTYRSANCSDKYMTTPASVLVSPPVGLCVDLPPQTNALSIRVMNGAISSDCELYIYEAPDCAESAMKVYVQNYRDTESSIGPYKADMGKLRCESWWNQVPRKSYRERRTGPKRQSLLWIGANRFEGIIWWVKIGSNTRIPRTPVRIAPVFESLFRIFAIHLAT